MNRRMERVNVLLREDISRVIAHELKDPRISSIVSVTRVEASADIRRAKVFISVLGDKTDKENTLIALRSAGGFIHRSMRGSLVLKNVPFLTFRLDESIEKGAEMLEMIKRVLSNTEAD